MKFTKFLFCILALTFLDILIKVIITQNFADTQFDIIPGLLEFVLVFNTKYSYVNGLFGLGVGYWTHIITYILLSIPFFLLHCSLWTLSSRRKLIDITFIFGFAGFLSAIISTLVWGGCPDYIYLKPWFVFDLKDLYIDAFVCLFIYYAVTDKDKVKTVKLTKDIAARLKKRISY